MYVYIYIYIYIYIIHKGEIRGPILFCRFGSYRCRGARAEVHVARVAACACLQAMKRGR